MIQVPELDMAVAGGDEVGAVVGEGDGRHLTGDLIGSNQDVFLRNKRYCQGRGAEGRTGTRSGLEEGLPNLPVPHVDHHVVLVSHTDDVFPIRRERHAGDAVFVLQQLADLHTLRHIPDPHRRHVPALGSKRMGRGHRCR